MRHTRFVMTVAIAAVVSLVSIAYAETWVQTDWSGGPGQDNWSDTTMFLESDAMSFQRIPGDLFLDAPNDGLWETSFGLNDPTWAYCILEASDGNFYLGTAADGNVYKSTSYGLNWENTTNLQNAVEIHDLLETSDGKMLAGASRESTMGAAIFVSTDYGATWNTTGDISSERYAYHIIEATSGDLFAATGDNGKVYRSTDGGETWVNTGELAGARKVHALLEYNGALIAATNPDANIFKSTDWGDTWTETGDLLGAERAWCLTVDDMGDIYVGTSSDGDVFKSTDGGDTWANTGEMDGASLIRGLLLSQEGVLYAGSTQSPRAGSVFRSTDYGTTWTETGDLVGSLEVWELIQGSHGPIYACSTPASYILFAAGHYGSGWLVSSVYECEPSNTEWGIMTWDADIFYETLTFKVRTDASPDMGGATDWGSCDEVTNGQDISDLNSVSDGQLFIQYRVEMQTTHVHRSPLLYEVSIECVLGVAEEEEESDVVFRLARPWPNPMGSNCTIEFTLEREGEVNLSIYDTAGRLVRTLVHGPHAPGVHRTSWNGCDEMGVPVGSGIYFAHLEANHRSVCDRVVVLK